MELLIIAISILTATVFIISMYFHFKDLALKIDIQAQDSVLTEEDIDQLAEKLAKRLNKEQEPPLYKLPEYSIEINEPSSNVIDFKSKIKGFKNVG